MIAIPSAGSPIGDPSGEYPSPYASGASASYRIEWQALWDGRFCEVKGQHMNPLVDWVILWLVPDSTGLEVGWGTGKNGSRESVTRLTAIHDALGDWRELSKLRGGKNC